MRKGGQSQTIKQTHNEFERIERLQNNGHTQEALEAGRALAAKQPKWPYAQYSIGMSYFLLGRFEDARKAFRKAISIQQGVSGFHAKLGETLHRLDDIEGAIKEIDTAIEIDANNQEYLITKAWMLRLRGENEQAYELLDTLYNEGSRDHRLVRIYAGTLSQMGEPERGIEALEPLSKADHTDPKVIGAHCYVLAKLYDQSARYDDAYAAASRGAELNAKTYDPQARELLLRERLDAWSSESMPELARSRATSEKPVFIVGMPRSGTTLIEQIIAAHPRAYGAGELINIFTAAQELVTPSETQHTIKDLVAGLKTASLDRTARRILRDMEKQAPSGSKPERICDKLLLNFQHLGLIEQLFPKARVIICRRDPLDTFISSYLLDFEGHNAHAYTDNPEWFAHFYALHTRYIEHYKQVCTLDILDIRYEEVVEDQQGSTERLLSFLGLEFDEACLSFHEHQRSVITASTDQVRKKIYRGAMSRHKNYEAHLGPVRAALQAEGIELD